MIQSFSQNPSAKLFFGIRGTSGIQYLCPFAFKARSTTLIFVECLAFQQTSLHDDVDKVLAVFTGHKLCFGMFLVHPSYTEIQQIWPFIDIEITCLK